MPTYAHGHVPLAQSISALVADLKLKGLAGSSALVARVHGSVAMRQTVEACRKVMISNGFSGLRSTGVGSVSLQKAVTSFSAILNAPPLAIQYGVAGWYDASKIQQLSGGLAQFTDLSGNNYHILQPTANLQGQVGVETVNGLPSLLFDGIDDTLPVPVALRNRIQASNNTVLVVARQNTAGNKTLYAGRNSTDDYKYGVWNFGASQLEGANNPTYTSSRLNVNTDTNVHVFGHRRTGSIVNVIRDGILGWGVAAADITMTALRFGSNAVGGAVWPGPICEIMIFDFALTNAQISALVAEFNNKWGTTAAELRTVTAALMNRRHINTFGDSLTFGQGATINYTMLLSNWLGVEASNRGISSTTLANSTNDVGGVPANNGRDRYIAATTGANKRDLLVSMYGTNDLLFQGWPNYNGATGLANYANDYQEVITGWLGAGYAADDIVLCSPPFIDKYNFAPPTATGANVTLHEQYVAKVKELAQTNGVWYAATYEATKAIGPSGLDVDGLHLNNIGQQACAIAIINCTKVSP